MILYQFKKKKKTLNIVKYLSIIISEKLFDAYQSLSSIISYTSKAVLLVVILLSYLCTLSLYQHWHEWVGYGKHT